MATFSPVDESGSGQLSARAGLLYQTNEVPMVEPADDAPPVEADEHSMLGVAELLLKAPAQVDRLTRDADRQPELILRFLAIALTSFSLFSAELVLTLDCVPEAALPDVLAHRWHVGVGPPADRGLALALRL